MAILCFIAGLHSSTTRATGLAPGDHQREQSRHTESISYGVMPYAKLQQIIDIPTYCMDSR